MNLKTKSKNKDKIILVVSHSARFIGGIEKYILELSSVYNSDKINMIYWVGSRELVSDINKKKHCTGEVNRFSILIKDKISFIFFLMVLFPARFVYYLKIRKLIQKSGGKLIIHINSLSEQILLTPIAQLLKIEVIWTIHGVVNFKKNYLLKYLFAKNASRTKTVISVSKSVYDSIKDIKANHQVVLNAVEIPPIRKKHYIKNNPKFAFVGRICYEKNFDYFIQLINRLSIEIPNIDVVVAGDGPLYQSYGKILSKRPYRYLGFINDLDKVWLNTDFILMPSYNFEGLPYVLLEAMSYGVIPLVSKIGPFKEVITENKNGLFLQLSLKEDVALIKKNIINENNINRLSENAYNYVKISHRIDNFYEKMRAVYDL